ncbi:metallophosphoesterase, partial [Listeria monocytogenes]|nr:metallophosphoesterase [Listeria monocytogenes]
RISTIIKKQKLLDRDTIVIDGGDFKRGNPMTDMYNTIKRKEDNPVISVMNKIGYDVVVPGNHEFDYGMENLKKINQEAAFPLISANIYH